MMFTDPSSPLFRSLLKIMQQTWGSQGNDGKIQGTNQDWNEQSFVTAFDEARKNMGNLNRSGAFTQTVSSTDNSEKAIALSLGEAKKRFWGNERPDRQAHRHHLELAKKASHRSRQNIQTGHMGYIIHYNRCGYSWNGNGILSGESSIPDL